MNHMMVFVVQSVIARTYRAHFLFCFIHGRLFLLINTRTNTFNAKENGTSIVATLWESIGTRIVYFFIFLTMRGQTAIESEFRLEKNDFVVRISMKNLAYNKVE